MTIVDFDSPVKNLVGWFFLLFFVVAFGLNTFKLFGFPMFLP